MGLALSPSVVAISTTIPARDGFQSTPPILWHTTASELNAESISGFNGNFMEDSGAVLGPQQTNPECRVDITGSSSSGLPNTINFDIISQPGGLSSNLYSLSSGGDGAIYGYDSGAFTNGHYENLTLTQNAAWSYFSPFRVVVQVTFGPDKKISVNGYDSKTQYLSIELANGSTVNYRIYFSQETGVQLQYQEPTVAGWQTVASSRHITGEFGGASHSAVLPNYKYSAGGVFDFLIYPDATDGSLTVKVNGYYTGQNVTLHHKGKSGLPALTRISVDGFYCYNSKLKIQPIQFQSLSISKGKRFFGSDKIANAGNAVAYTNFTGQNRSDQTDTLALATDGAGNASFNLTSVTPVSSLLGVSNMQYPPSISDVLVYVPSLWSSGSVGFPLPLSALPVMQCFETQEWDDAARMGTVSGSLVINNKDNVFTGAFGNYALDLWLSNGYLTNQRVSGIIDGSKSQGLTVRRKDPFRSITVPFSDKFAIFQRPIGQEVILDGLCIYTAIRLLMDIGQVNPSVYASTIPDTGFPSSGGYGSGFPYYILGRGTGLNPKYRFSPDASVLSVLMSLVQDSGDLDGTPHYMWFDPAGQFHWEGYNPLNMAVKRFYLGNDPTGVGQIFDIEVYNSIENLRTEVIVQGQDAQTYELLQWSFPLPSNFGTVGYQYPVLVRNARYANQQYMAYIATMLARQSTLPTQVVKIKVPFWPDVFAGDVIGIGEDKALGRIGLFTILSIHSSVAVRDIESTGDAVHQDCYSIIIARSIENSIPFSGPFGGYGGSTGGGSSSGGSGDVGGGSGGSITGGGGSGSGGDNWWIGNRLPPDAGI